MRISKSTKTSVKASAEPNTPDANKTKLVKQIIKQAEGIRDYFQSHNNNLNRTQEQYLDDLSDGIDSQSVMAIRDAIEGLKYNSKSLRKDQYYLIEDLYDEFNLANGKFEGMGRPGSDDVDACRDIKASVDSDIAKYKKSLESKAAKSGVSENFGAAEVRKLKDKYRTLPDDDVDYRTAEHNRNSIDSFEDWCMNYVGANTSTDKALQHIKAAIDILGKSGDKSDVTKDSIANLGVIMFDLQGKK